MALGIASNFDGRLTGICDELDPLSRSHAVFCSSTVGCSKPGLEFFHEIQRQLGVPADSILLVGDNPHCDVAGAAAAGWQGLLIDRDSPRRDGVLRSFSQLVDLLGV